MTVSTALAIGLPAGALLGVLSTLALRRAAHIYCGSGHPAAGLLAQGAGMLLAVAGLTALASLGGGPLMAGLGAFTIVRFAIARRLPP